MTATAQPRQALYLDLTMIDSEGQYVPSLVTEGVYGYQPLTGDGESRPWQWGSDYRKAKDLVAESNAQRGLTPDDVLNIVASSMSAAPAAKPAALKGFKMVITGGDGRTATIFFDRNGRNSHVFANGRTDVQARNHAVSAGLAAVNEDPNFGPGWATDYKITDIA